ncbi:unnamed protein product [Nezara viridula]|uniref:Uncharacterized protein n=1 Tax=Nezara viridula TaxID=85310 RepID=A0A9P0E3R7_NEZVI|nr:unnamed protein product [Nezara viridula]
MTIGIKGLCMDLRCGHPLLHKFCVCDAISLKVLLMPEPRGNGKLKTDLQETLSDSCMDQSKL